MSVVVVGEVESGVLVVVTSVLALGEEGGGVCTVDGAIFLLGGVVEVTSDVVGLEFDMLVCTGAVGLNWAVCSGGDAAVKVGFGEAAGGVEVKTAETCCVVFTAVVVVSDFTVVVTAGASLAVIDALVAAVGVVVVGSAEGEAAGDTLGEVEATGVATVVVLAESGRVVLTGADSEGFGSTAASEAAKTTSAGLSAAAVGDTVLAGGDGAVAAGVVAHVDRLTEDAASGAGAKLTTSAGTDTGKGEVTWSEADSDVESWFVFAAGAEASVLVSVSSASVDSESRLVLKTAAEVSDVSAASVLISVFDAADTSEICSSPTASAAVTKSLAGRRLLRLGDRGGIPSSVGEVGCGEGVVVVVVVLSVSHILGGVLGGRPLLLLSGVPSEFMLDSAEAEAASLLLDWLPPLPLPSSCSPS